MNNEVRIAFNAGKVYGEHIYYSDNYCNALMEYNLNDDTIRFVRCFPDDKLEKTFLHRDCIEYEGKLYFTPNTSGHISVFEPKEKRIETIQLNRIDESKFCFCEGILKGNELYIVPGDTAQKLLKVDLSNGHIEEMVAFHEVLRESPKRTQEFWKVAIADNELILPRLNTHTIVIYDINTGDASVYEFDGCEWAASFYVHGRIWLSSTDGRVYRWDRTKKRPIEYSVASNKRKPCASIVVGDRIGNVYLIPEYGRCIYILINNERFECVDGLVRNSHNLDTPEVNYESFDLWDNRIVLFPRISGGLVMINKETVSERNVSCLLNDKEYMGLYYAALNYMSCNSVIREGKPYFFNEYVGMLNLSQI